MNHTRLAIELLALLNTTIVWANERLPQSRLAEGVLLPVEEHRREIRVVDAQVADDVRLLVILHRAMQALESRRLLALMPQVRQHRLLPLVQVAATGTLVHVVALVEEFLVGARSRVRRLVALAPRLQRVIWNPRKDEGVLVQEPIHSFVTWTKKSLACGWSPRVSTLFRAPANCDGRVFKRDRSLSLVVRETLTS